MKLFLSWGEPTTPVPTPLPPRLEPLFLQKLLQAIHIQMEMSLRRLEQRPKIPGQLPSWNSPIYDLSESSDVSKNQGVVFVEYYQELTELSWNPTALPTVYGFTPINTSCPNEPSDCNERVLLMRLAQSFEQSFLRFLNIFGFLVFAHHPHRDVAQQGDRIATWKSRSTLINQRCHQWLVLGSS